MNEDESIEQSPQEVNDESQNINRETSNVNEKTTNLASDIITSEIKNMEVHHHPDLHHKRKNFREYFLEFLMIFLAVTMGFFAENIREGFADRNKEKVYMENLLADLIEILSK